MRARTDCTWISTLSLLTKNPASCRVIPADPFDVLVAQHAKAANVHVVFEIGKLHQTGERVRRRARDVCHVLFAFAVSQRIDGVDDFFREAFFAKLVESPSAVFDDIVENGRDFGVHQQTDVAHHAERMKDVRFTVLAKLTFVGFYGDGNGSFEGLAWGQSRSLKQPAMVTSEQ